MPRRPTPQVRRVDRPCAPVFAVPLNRRHEAFTLGVALLLCLALCGAYLAQARQITESFGFPLDDAWIHLTFARNLAVHGSFAYYPGDPPVAGSTAPLYTGLLAALYGTWHNEFIISYILGIAALIAGMFLFYALARREFASGPWSALAATLLFATQPRLILLALSGMETTLFIALILAALLAYRSGHSVLLGVCLGLVLWCRPDGLVLWLAIGADWAVRRLNGGHHDEDQWRIRPIIQAFVVALLFAAGYAAYNWALSGSPLPTTFGAKGVYYRATMTRGHFLTVEVADAFGRGELSILWVFGALALITTLWNVFEGRPTPWLVHALFVLGLVTAYYVVLPFAHRFGRYLMPALPSCLLMACGAVYDLAWLAARKGRRTCVVVRWAPAGILALLLVQWVVGARHFAAVYAACCAYHDTHHVATARWLAQNTPEDARIATHDIGALAFYSGRRIVDMAGIVSPEVIAHIGTPDYTAYLDEFLIRSGATHTVTLGDWFVPANSPRLYVPSPEPEILTVHSFLPGITHIELPIVASLIAQAGNLLDRGKPHEALGLLQEIFRRDTRSSRAHLLVGAAHAMLGDDALARQMLHRSLELYPGSALAHFELARLDLRAGAAAEAAGRLRASLKLDPSFSPAQELLAEIEAHN
ncbi:hypothetical protein JXA88_01755 [Candidatus Fermentibacteria bacterium]|nr:hypothetical protein [Candidatus Fermentibacteria bacterium]